MTLSQSLKPSVPRRWLLAIAGVFWSFAGCMLIFRGFAGLLDEGIYVIPQILLSAACGLAFYFLMFAKISRRHIRRILGIKPERPCMFSFFNIRSYIMMTIMISSGIILRKTDILNHQVLFSMYFCMGIPLLLSSIKFYYYWFTNKKV